MSDFETAKALFMQALSAQDSGQSAVAEGFLRRALVHAPGRESILTNLAAVLIAQEKFEEALGLCKDLSITLPRSAVVWLNLGLCQTACGYLVPALESIQRALALAPDDAAVQGAHGDVLLRLERADEALGAFDKALRLEPAQAGWYSSRGVVLRALRRFEDARQAQLKALQIDPEFAEAHWNAALLDLMLGDYARAWARFEWRWKTSREVLVSRYTGQAPAWQGEALAGRRILLWAEQGLGDVIQFSRYAKVLLGQGAQVVLQLPASLVRLCQSLDVCIQVIAEGDVLPQHDLQCALMSVPFRLQTQAIPVDIPYLYAPDLQGRPWHEDAEASGRLRVGLMWQGNQLNRKALYRSMQAENLLPLLALPCHFIGVGKDNSAGDVALLARNGDFTDYSPLLMNFADTASLIATLDVVITIDTSVAHLSAALGKPTWVVLSTQADWRWGQDGDSSPWYPGVTRLFRQGKPGGWDEVMAELCGALSAQGEVGQG